MESPNRKEAYVHHVYLHIPVLLTTPFPPLPYCSAGLTKIRVVFSPTTPAIFLKQSQSVCLTNKMLSHSMYLSQGPGIRCCRVHLEPSRAVTTHRGIALTLGSASVIQQPCQIEKKREMTSLKSSGLLWGSLRSFPVTMVWLFNACEFLIVEMCIYIYIY